MGEFVKPRIVVSKCLEFAACRYNGDVIKDKTVENLARYVEFIPVCPEVAIGLGTPRETIRIVKAGEENRLMQPSTEADLTEKMNAFSDQFLTSVGDVDGFILKNRSPSCGVQDVKIYGGLGKVPVIEKGSGFFGGAVSEHFPGAAIEEEGRLKNFTIREKFFTKLFVLAEFRQLRDAETIKPLLSFHSRHKYLFMAYSQPKLKEMGRIAANKEKRAFSDVYYSYEKVLTAMFQRAARYDSNVNVCMHMMGYFKKQLSSEEKQHFLEMLEKFKEKRLPLSSLLSVLKSWALRFNEEYLLMQSYFEPYPEALMEISDSGKGRNYS